MRRSKLCSRWARRLLLDVRSRWLLVWSKRCPRLSDRNSRLGSDRTVYLRSHLVLNSAYFLSSENLLDLGSGLRIRRGRLSPEFQGRTHRNRYMFCWFAIRRSRGAQGTGPF